jgi:hypothetical protein
MSDEEYFATRTRLRQALGRLKALQNDAYLPASVGQPLRYAIKHVEDALLELQRVQVAPRDKQQGKEP